MKEFNSFDDILKLVGTHGKWQIMVFFLTALTGFLVAFHNMGAVFLAATPKHWCSSPTFTILRNNYSWTEDDIKEVFIPHHYDKNEKVYASCSMYNVNFSLFNESDWYEPNLIYNYTRENPSHLEIQHCTSWTYDKSQYTSTVISEWDLVCDHKALSSTIQSSFMGGVVVGCFLFGWVSDVYGRRKAVLISIVLFSVASMLAAFSTHYIMFIILRFISAIGDAGAFSVAFVIVTEISGRKSRAVVGQQYMVPFSAGFMVLPGIAYFIRDWFTLQLAISVPTAVLVIYFWYLPESPRFMLMKGRPNEALQVLKSGAKMNGQSLPPDIEMLELLEEVGRSDRKVAEVAAQKAGNIFDLVRTPKLRKRSMVIALSWFVAGLVYYGLTFSAPYIGISVYLYLFFAAAVEVPAFTIVQIVIQRIGRRPVLIVGIIISGLSCLFILATPNDLTWVIAVLALLGKFFSTGFYGLLFLYTVEMFPTPVRNVSVGTGNMLSRVGSVAAPYITDLLRHYHESIPMSIFGSLSIISGLLAIALPETMGHGLPETIEEIEGSEFKKSKRDAIEMVNMNATGEDKTEMA